MKQTHSFAYHRAKTRRNLPWIVILVALLWMFSGCASQRYGCPGAAGTYRGYHP
jgi:hypothetical protein